jgi:hypothetical protein
MLEKFAGVDQLGGMAHYFAERAKEERVYQPHPWGYFPKNNKHKYDKRPFQERSYRLGRSAVRADAFVLSNSVGYVGIYINWQLIATLPIKLKSQK